MPDTPSDDLDLRESRDYRREPMTSPRSSESSGEPSSRVPGGGHVGVFLFDANGRIIDINPAAIFLLGRSKRELIGHALGHIPNLNSKEEDPIEINCISHDGQVRFCELRIHCTDFSGLTAATAALLNDPVENASATATQDERSTSGADDPSTSPADRVESPPVYIGTLYDVTPYRDAAVSARAEVVRRDEFLATLSHELRNPLSAISGGFELLRDEQLGSDSRQEAAQMVAQQLTQLRRLLDDLLDMTRLAHDRVTLKSELCDLRAPIDAAAKMAGVISDEDIVGRVNVDLPDEPLTLNGDLARLEQLVANLIVNALKYGGSESDVCVLARRYESQDAADAASKSAGIQRGRVAEVVDGCRVDPGPGGLIELRVSDEGAGIDATLLPYLFDPFVQAQRTFGRSDGGFGIGLTLVRDLATLHGGTVWAESDGVGHGATFVVQLPAELPVEDKPQTPASTAMPDGLSVLLVEDVPAIRKVTAKLLERLGYTVVQAVDAPTALLAIENHPFDLALIDIGLPGPSGLTIAEAVRGDSRYGEMKLVALTGYGQTSDHEASRESGFDTHLTKPFDLTTFRAAVRELFGTS